MIELGSTLQSSSGMLLLGGIAFIAGGAIFIERFLHVRTEQISARTELVAPWTHQQAHVDVAGEAYVSQRATGSGRAEQELTRHLRKRSLPLAYAPMVLLALRLASALCLLAAGWIAYPLLLNSGALLVRLSLAGFMSGCGWLVPGLFLRLLARRRAAAVVAGLPDALELLVICADAGLALEDGINRIIAELEGSQPMLADELSLTAADLRILPSRDMAFARLAARIEVPIMRSIVTTLSQSMQYGTPLSQAMRTVAAEMRNESLIRLEERANKLPALLTVPMMLFIMPTIFLIVAGPAALNAIDAFSR
jgi:tight adherence protein C